MADVEDLEPEEGGDAEESGHAASLRAELDRREALRIAEALVFASAQPVSTTFIEERLPRGISATDIL
ncbi:MAG: SMC-Scp complex subunit ScpB, partial [Allorhizobium sp.]